MTTSWEMLTDLLSALKPHGPEYGPPQGMSDDLCASDAQRYSGHTLVVDPAVMYLESATYLRAMHYQASMSDTFEMRDIIELIDDHPVNCFLCAGGQVLPMYSYGAMFFENASSNGQDPLRQQRSGSRTPSVPFKLHVTD